MFAPAISYARRQRYRHLVRSVVHALSAALVLLAAVSASRSGGDVLMAFGLLLFGACLSWTVRRSQRLAARWRVGADSERAVRLALKGLAREGWVVRNGVRWPGGGDVDHLVRSPDGLGFAVETKTLTFSQSHLWRTDATARWAGRRRRRYPCGVIPVLCVVRARRVEGRCDGVVVVSLDRLLPVLERLAVSTRHVGGRVPSPVRSAAPGGHDG
jgi:hypothetical protein